VLTADDPPLAPKYVRDKAWPGGDRTTTLKLRQEFAARISLPILLDLNKLKEAIRDGIRLGLWLYFDPARGCAWSKDSTTAPLVAISSDIELILPESAGVPICDVSAERPAPPEATCPVCHRPISECICGRPRPPRPGPIEDRGPATQIFQGLLDQARERGIPAIAGLSLRVEGSKAGLLKKLRTMGLAVPQFPKASVTVEAFAALDLDDGSHLELRYVGPWARYKALHDIVQHVKDNELRDGTGHLELRLAFDGGLDVEGPELGTIRDVLQQLDPGELVLRATPKEEA
jgi:hypothetical protein